jgi:hypothetical protein
MPTNPGRRLSPTTQGGSPGDRPPLDMRPSPNAIPIDPRDLEDADNTPPFDTAIPTTPAPAHPNAPASTQPAADAAKIRMFDQKLGSGHHKEKWQRQPNLTGTGAIHVKSFHCKLTGDSLDFLDQQINEWLDAHPDYEVKMVTTSVGDWTGKLKEPNLIVNVWV